MEQQKEVGGDDKWRELQYGATDAETTSSPVRMFEQEVDVVSRGVGHGERWVEAHWSAATEKIDTVGHVAPMWQFALVGLILIAVVFYIINAFAPRRQQYKNKAPKHRKPWEQVLDSSEEDRCRRLNGETEAQITQADRYRNAFKGKSDRDQHFPLASESEIPGKASNAATADSYVFYTSIISLAPKVILMMVPMLILHLPAALLAVGYIRALQCGGAKMEAIPRTPSFHVVCTVVLVLMAPVGFLVLFSLLYDYATMSIWNMIYYIVVRGPREGFNLTASKIFEARKAINPYRGGPGILTHLEDIVVAFMGHTVRHPFGQSTWMLCIMWLVMPYVKYHMNINPYTHDIKPRFVQQISASMEDVDKRVEFNDDLWDVHPDAGGARVAEAARAIITHTLPDAHILEDAAHWNFVPHYPYPPGFRKMCCDGPDEEFREPRGDEEGSFMVADRRWAMGIQAGGTFPLNFLLLVHTTHANVMSEGITQQMLVSDSAELPLYRVMLWYNNPFHFLTGFVEASVTNGQPGQTDKKLGGEHPMWLLASDSDLHAKRGSITGSGMIDAFFDRWLPKFVMEIRYMTFQKLFRRRKDDSLAKGQPPRHQRPGREAFKYAFDNYQEVETKDGISKLSDLKGGENYIARNQELRQRMQQQDNSNSREDLQEQQFATDQLQEDHLYNSGWLESTERDGLARTPT